MSYILSTRTLQASSWPSGWEGGGGGGRGGVYLQRCFWPPCHTYCRPELCRPLPVPSGPQHAVVSSHRSPWHSRRLQLVSKHCRKESFYEQNEISTNENNWVTCKGLAPSSGIILLRSKLWSNSESVTKWGKMKDTVLRLSYQLYWEVTFIFNKMVFLNTMPLFARKCEKAIFSMKVKVKVTRPCCYIKRASLVEYACQVWGLHLLRVQKLYRSWQQKDKQTDRAKIICPGSLESGHKKSDFMLLWLNGGLIDNWTQNDITFPTLPWEHWGKLEPIANLHFTRGKISTSKRKGFQPTLVDVGTWGFQAPALIMIPIIIIVTIDPHPTPSRSSLDQPQW